MFARSGWISSQSTFSTCGCPSSGETPMNLKSILHSTWTRGLAIVTVMSATTAWGLVTSVEMTPATPNPPIIGGMLQFNPDNMDGVASVSWTLISEYGANCFYSSNFTGNIFEMTGDIPLTFRTSRPQFLGI